MKVSGVLIRKGIYKRHQKSLFNVCGRNSFPPLIRGINSNTYLTFSTIFAFGFYATRSHCHSTYMIVMW